MSTGAAGCQAEWAGERKRHCWRGTCTVWCWRRRCAGSLRRPPASVAGHLLRPGDGTVWCALVSFQSS